MSDAVLEVDHLSRRYGTVQAVADVSFQLDQGQTICLLGPSGCGKSTTLRVIAGLEEPDGGVIRLRGRVVASAIEGFSLPPERRNVGLVFQSYAVWPHMTVFENVAYPLRARGVRGNEVRRRVLETLELVDLDQYAYRRATQLSGGQQQRVALARALVYEPDLLLLDEPLSNLDFRRRHAMRVYLKNLQRRLGITVLFVTHDRIEAMTLSHRIAVMRDGLIEDIGTPDRIYRSAATRFVYDFVGRSINLTGHIESEGGVTYLALKGARMPIETSAVNRDGGEVVASIRPEDIWIEPDVSSAPGAPLASVEDVSFLGGYLECSLRLGDHLLVLDAPPSMSIQAGTHVALRVRPDSVRVWPKDAAG